MHETFDAVYENGVFRPLEPVPQIDEHCRVKITVDVDESPKLTVHDCVGIMPDADAKELQEIISDEFEKVDLNEWK